MSRRGRPEISVKVVLGLLVKAAVMLHTAGTHEPSRSQLTVGVTELPGERLMSAPGCSDNLTCNESEPVLMRVVCVGGGPAGLYLAILLKRADPAHRVVVLERKSRHCTDGWGVVFWDDLLDDLRATDAETARLVSEHTFPWRGQHLVLEGEQVDHEGDGYAIAAPRRSSTYSSSARPISVSRSTSTTTWPAPPSSRTPT